MRQSKFTETQIVSILKEADAGRPSPLSRRDGARICHQAPPRPCPPAFHTGDFCLPFGRSHLPLAPDSTSASASMTSSTVGLCLRIVNRPFGGGAWGEVFAGPVALVFFEPVAGILAPLCAEFFGLRMSGHHLRDVEDEVREWQPQPISDVPH